MPINPKLKAIIDANPNMSADYKANLIETLGNADPDFQNGWMANADYTRNTNAWKTEKDKFTAEMTDFYTKSKTALSQWEAKAADADKYKTAADQAAARIAELEAGGIRTPGAEDAAQKEIAGLKSLLTNLQTTIDTKLANVATDEKLTEQGKAWAGYIGNQILTLDETASRHQEITGKRMTLAEKHALIEHANKMSAADGGRPVGLDKAYEDMNKDTIKSAERQQWEKEYAETHKSQFTPQGGQGGVPGPSGPELGPLQIRLAELEREARGDKTGAPIYKDWKEASAAAAKDLVNQGKY